MINYKIITFLLSLSSLTALTLWSQNNSSKIKELEKNYTKQLINAVKQTDIPLMKQLISQGADVNKVKRRDFPHGGYPVLRYAIDTHNLQTVQTLLLNGANPNEFTEIGLKHNPINPKTGFHVFPRNFSLLLYAICSKAPISIIKELLKYGANINGEPKSKELGDWTALQVASYCKYDQAVEEIVQREKNNK